MPSPNVATIPHDQVPLSITSFDRLYLGGYVPMLQTSGQVVAFCRNHLGQPIASPALFRPLRDRFIQAVQTFADQHQVPIISFTRGQRSFSAQEGVMFIGVAQERARAMRGRRAVDDQGAGHLRVRPRDGGGQPLLSLRCDEQSRVVTKRR